MKQLFIFFFATSLLLICVACDRHPASQTIPGYQENSHILQNKESLLPSNHSVKLFPEKKTTSLN